jgi:hypothetical protein
MVRDPLTSDLFLFDGGIICNFCASKGLCTFSLSEEKGLLVRGSLKECLKIANQKVCVL